MTKISKTLEDAFQSHIESEILFTSRIMCILGALLYASFIIADLYSISASLTEILLIRGLVAGSLIAGYFLTYSKVFLKYYDQLVFIILISATVGIEAMIYLATPEEHAAKVYFVGLLLVIMTTFAWTFLKKSTSLIAVSFIIGSYAYLGFHKGLVLSDLLVNIYLLLSAVAIGFISQVIRNRHLRENFLLGQSLERAYKEKEEEAKGNEYLANHDGLTGLPNRRYMMELLDKSLTEAKEKNRVLAILFLDLNGFKQVNDVHGHAFGDEVLKTVASRLQRAIPQGDYLSRLGGDEYVISIMLNKENLSEIESLTEKFSSLISLPMIMEGERIKVGTSIGISAYPMDGNTIDSLMEIADHKMYQDKALKHESKERRVS
ncbi:MAG: GGDEF domain-containing protein [Cocleimonas sp.]